MPLDWDELKGQTYECARCGKQIKGEELIFLERLTCPNCGYRVLKKIRPPVVRKVKAK
jgi:DNA-directed RNA polymerase subunit P